METTVVKAKDFWECDRCEADNSTDKANSLNKKYCPCPRGSCDAIITGTVVTTVEIIKNKISK